MWEESLKSKICTDLAKLSLKSELCASDYDIMAKMLKSLACLEKRIFFNNLNRNETKDERNARRMAKLKKLLDYME